jgi:hypothetical protein
MQPVTPTSLENDALPSQIQEYPATPTTINRHATDTLLPADATSYCALELPRDPRSIQCKGSRFTDAVSTLPIFPFFGTLLALLTYDYCRHLPTAPLSPLGGSCGTYNLIVTALAFCIWCLTSMALCHAAGASRSDTANRRAYLQVYSKLNAVFGHLRDNSCRLAMEQSNGALLPTTLADDARRRIGAYNAACLQYNKACAVLAVGGPQWMDGAGYVNVTTILHRAEENLFEFEDELAVLGDALYDYQRIETSTIDAGVREQLLAKIKCATYAISPGIYRLYWTDNNGDKQSIGKSTGVARATLRVVRRTMNELRDGIRAELVRVRTKSINASTFLGVSVFVLVMTGILAYSHPRPPTDSARLIVGPLIFFLVAAATGLVYRLYSDSRAGRTDSIKGSEDSDLTDVPFEFAPLVSGIAGLGGILVTGGLAILTSAPGQAIPYSVSPLFDPAVLGQSVIVAAAFGIAPGLLFDRLAQYTDGLKKDLQSSSAAPQTSTPPASK